MQVCTSLQTDNHASTRPLSFLQAGCPSCCPTNSVKALKLSWNRCRKKQGEWQITYAWKTAVKMQLMVRWRLCTICPEKKDIFLWLLVKGKLFQRKFRTAYLNEYWLYLYKVLALSVKHYLLTVSIIGTKHFYKQLQINKRLWCRNFHRKNWIIIRTVFTTITSLKVHSSPKSIVPSVLWRCWLGGRKGIWPVKNWVVRCWHSYQSGARCRLAYGPADITATHCLLL